MKVGVIGSGVVGQTLPTMASSLRIAAAILAAAAFSISPVHADDLDSGRAPESGWYILSRTYAGESGGWVTKPKQHPDGAWSYFKKVAKGGYLGWYEEIFFDRYGHHTGVKPVPGPDNISAPLGSIDPVRIIKDQTSGLR